MVSPRWRFKCSVFFVFFHSNCSSYYRVHGDGIRLIWQKLKQLQKPNGYRHITHKVHGIVYICLNMNWTALENCCNLEHNCHKICAANKCLLFVSAFIYLFCRVYFFISSVSLDPRYSSTSIGLYSFFSLYFNVMLFNQNNQQIELKQNQNKIHRYTERKVSKTG